MSDPAPVDLKVDVGDVLHIIRPLAAALRAAEAQFKAETAAAHEENATLRARVAELEAQLATARAEERERCRSALRRYANRANMLSLGIPPTTTAEWIADNLDALVANPYEDTPTPEPPHA